jgi:DNA invertase Pin-like site-specific DNA recombinase
MWKVNNSICELIRQLQAEGIAAAKAKGKRLGRKPIEMPENFHEACVSCEQDALSIREAAQKIWISHTTFYRNYKEYLSKNTEKTVLNSRLFEMAMI